MKRYTKIKYNPSTEEVSLAWEEDIGDGVKLKATREWSGHPPDGFCAAFIDLQRHAAEISEVPVDSVVKVTQVNMSFKGDVMRAVFVVQRSLREGRQIMNYNTPVCAAESSEEDDPTVLTEECRKAIGDVVEAAEALPAEPEQLSLFDPATQTRLTGPGKFTQDRPELRSVAA